MANKTKTSEGMIPTLWLAYEAPISETVKRLSELGYEVRTMVSPETITDRHNEIRIDWLIEHCRGHGCQALIDAALVLSEDQYAALIHSRIEIVD